MSKQSIFLLILIIGVFSFSASAKWYQFKVERNYYASASVSCDPSTESCFVYDCEEGDEECDPEPFKYIYKNASQAPVCDSVEGCAELTCGENEDGCEVTECSEDEVEEGQYCLTE